MSVVFENYSATACLMGCAIGDSLGLPFENLPPRRIAKFLKIRSLNQRFLFGHGMVSDDTEHSLIVARCLDRHPENPDAFEKALAREFCFWIAGCPAGIGFATLRSILKLCLGFPPQKSGVFSAGNGPAMRSAVIGCLLSENDDLRREMTNRSSRLTHTDPKASFGALAISEIAARVSRGEWKVRPDIHEVEKALRAISDDPEWQQITGCICEALHGEMGLPEFASSLGGKRGVSGYVYHTVPFAIACWYLYFGEFEATIEHCIRGGGDTDTTAAICGALAGISCYPDHAPPRWSEKIVFWPVAKSDFSNLSHSRPALVKVWFRNTLFLLTILVHCFRRCFPPY